MKVEKKRKAPADTGRDRRRKAKPVEESSSESSSSSDSKEDATAGPGTGSATAASTDLVMARVDDLTSKAISFSRALTRAQQALKTSARIAREAAVSFESEMENFLQAQRDINAAFNIDN